MEKMLKYYKDWKSNTKSEKIQKYCNKMIDLLENGVKPNSRKGKRCKIYVAYLDKVFDSKQAASKALGKNKHYTWGVLVGKLHNKYGIEEIY
jgi:gamma-glutamylcysteine synthetase